jgi:hypothetical protein
MQFEFSPTRLYLGPVQSRFTDYKQRHLPSDILLYDFRHTRILPSIEKTRNFQNLCDLLKPSIDGKGSFNHDKRTNEQ